MKLTLPFLFVIIQSALVCAQTAPLSIVPLPNQIRTETGYFQLNRKTQIVLRNEEDRPLAKLLNDRIQSELGFPLKISKRAARNAIFVSEPIVDYTVPDGGYELSVEKKPDPLVRFGIGRSLLRVAVIVSAIRNP
jgi:hypothetical protein